MDPQKVVAITNLKTPENTKKLGRFLVMIFRYRRFIPECSKITKILTKLLQNTVKWHWGTEHEEASIKLKSALTSTPILAPLNYDLPFVLQTDASDQDLSAVLTQNSGSREFVIAYANRTLNKHEINYSTTKKECLAVIWGI